MYAAGFAVGIGDIPAGIALRGNPTARQGHFYDHLSITKQGKINYRIK